MQSSQRLFDAGRGAGDLLAHDSFLERARLERERDNDSGARRALGAYLVARLIDRLLELETTDEAAQGFAWQLEGCRRFVFDVGGDDSEVSHLRGIIEAVNTDPQHRTSVVRVSLSAYAYYLEHEGRWPDALDILALAARTWGEPIPPRELAGLSLFSGRLNRLMARWDTAINAYTMAQEAATATGDRYSVLRARLGLGAVMRGQGNLPLARATAEEVIREAAEPELADVQAMAYADLGAALTRQGLRTQALQAMYDAFLRTNDPIQRTAVLGDLGSGLAELGSYDSARTAFEMVVDADASFQLKMNARLELMDIESTVGNRVSFERHRGVAKRVTDRMPPSMGVDFLYKAGIGLARFGQLERAAGLLQEGMQIAESCQLNEWYFTLDRTLRNLAAGEPCLGNNQMDSEAAGVPGDVLTEIGAGLRELRELARA